MPARLAFGGTLAIVSEYDVSNKSHHPRVDVIIAVHSPTRPVERAVASVLDGTSAQIRATVVVHNTSREGIMTRLGALAEDPRVRILELHDGIGSPAGPMNLGYASANAEFTCLIGSDDELEHGAIDAWLEAADRLRADVVIAPHRKFGGSIDPYPPVRARSTLLDGVRDRLAYRSAPLGLVSRSRFPKLRLTEGLGSGEDIAFVTTLWFAGVRVCFPIEAPSYLGHTDSIDRVSFEARGLDEDFAFLNAIEGMPLFSTLTPVQRTALVVKIFRIHIFDAILARCHSSGLDEETRQSLSAVIRRLDQWAPRARRRLAVADHRALHRALNPKTTADDLREALNTRWRYKTLAAIMTANPLYVFDRQAPLRTFAAGSKVVRRISAAATRRVHGASAQL